VAREQRVTPRRIALAWGAAAFLAAAALSGGLGISREEASVLAEAGAAPGAAPRLRPPLPALLSRASEAAAVRVGLPHLTGYRLAPALFVGLLAALLALLAAELAGPAAAALAPALLLCAPRLLLSLVQAGPRSAGTALAVATVLAYRRAVVGRVRAARLAAASAAGALLGLALAVQLEAVALLAALAAHAALLALRRPPSGAGPTSEPGSAPEGAGAADRTADRRGALAALAAMAILGPTLAFALWPALWAEPVQGIRAAFRALPGDSPLVYLGIQLSGARPPWGLPLVVTALALPASLLIAFLGGLVHAVARILSAEATPRARQGDLLLTLAAVAPLAAAQAGLALRAPGPGPWLAAFPFLAALAARAILAAAEGAWPSRARPIAAALAVAAIAPGIAAAIHAWPDLGASWGELAGGAPGAASSGLPRHEGEISPRLLEVVSARARSGARVRWTGVPRAALAVYAADGRVRPDLTPVDSLDEADLAIVPVSGRARQDEFQIWAALRTRAPAAGAFLDEVPLAWVYARPGAWH
jgi:hypothetical protein